METSTEDDSSDILRGTMESETRAVALGYLTITAPVVVITAATVYFLLYTFGPMQTPYFILTGVALSWQWYVMAIARWKESLTNRSFQCDEIERLARRSGLHWPGSSSIGAFAFHTAAAEICAVNLGPWLVFHWFSWILPLAGISTTTLGTDYYLQHLEVMSIVPALMVGYIVARHLPWLAITAWIVPTVILSYKLWSFVDPRASVLVAHSSTRFSYFFQIVPIMPTLRNFTSSDPVRVVQQMLVVAPFYSGIAYSVGGLVSRLQIFDPSTSGSRQMKTDSKEEGSPDETDTGPDSASACDSASR